MPSNLLICISLSVLIANTFGHSPTSAGPGVAAGLTEDILTDKNYEAWKKYILPGQQELKFLEIPWTLEFGKAVIEADKLDKPILLWAMNGHPLGCT